MERSKIGKEGREAWEMKKRRKIERGTRMNDLRRERENVLLEDTASISAATTNDIEASAVRKLHARIAQLERGKSKCRTAGTQTEQDMRSVGCQAVVVDSKLEKTRRKVRIIQQKCRRLEAKKKRKRNVQNSAESEGSDPNLSDFLITLLDNGVMCGNI